MDYAIYVSFNSKYIETISKYTKLADINNLRLFGNKQH